MPKDERPRCPLCGSLRVLAPWDDDEWRCRACGARFRLDQPALELVIEE